MAKIDRLGWAVGVGFVAYGLRVGIRTNSPEAVEQILLCLPPVCKPLSGPNVDILYSLVVGGAARPNVRTYSLLYTGALRLARTMEHETVYPTLQSDLQLRLAELARRRTFVHAGVVGWRGRAIVIPGRSMSGKTTLTTALVQAGATYYSDEYAIFDPSGLVHPYPRPPMIREEGVAAKRANGLVLDRTGMKPLPLGLVVVTGYKPQGRWSPRSVTAGRGMLALWANTVSARHRPDAILALFSRTLRGVPILKGTRGEAVETAARLLAEYADWGVGKQPARR